MPQTPSVPRSRPARKNRYLPRHTYGQRVLRLLGPSTPEQATLLLQAIHSRGQQLDPRIAPRYTRFLYYAARATHPSTFLLEIAAYLETVQDAARSSNASDEPFA